MSNRSKSWSWRHAILESGLTPTTRHVLLTISCCMNDLGEGCYRTTREFAEFTGLSERAIITHIQLACDAGWLVKNKHGFRGQKWKTHDYKAAWPDDDFAPENDQKSTGKKDKGTEPRSVASDAKALNVVPKGTEPNDIKALNDVQQDKNDSESSHSNLNARGRASERSLPTASQADASKKDGDDAPEREDQNISSENNIHELDDPKKSEKLFYEKFKNWPRFDVSPKAPMLNTWIKLSGDEKLAAAECVDRFLAKCKAEKISHPCAIASYLIERMWLGLPAKVITAAVHDQTVLKRFGPVWCVVRMRSLLNNNRAEWKPSKTQQVVVDVGKGHLWNEQRWRAEFPYVATLDKVQMRIEPDRVPPKATLERCKWGGVVLGSHEWALWRDYHSDNDWPFIGYPKAIGLEGAWFPALVPEGMV